MLSILDRYNWRQFGILTSKIAGHDDFVQAVRDQILNVGLHTRTKFVVQDVFKVSETNGWDVSELAESEVRIILLYCTQAEASKIMEKATTRGLTSHKYLWLVTQSVVGDPEDVLSTRNSLPTGMIGKDEASFKLTFFML